MRGSPSDSEPRAKILAGPPGNPKGNDMNNTKKTIPEDPENPTAEEGRAFLMQTLRGIGRGGSGVTGTERMRAAMAYAALAELRDPWPNTKDYIPALLQSLVFGVPKDMNEDSGRGDP